MRVVVVGGAGYVGSVVTEHLVRAGHAVTVLDDLSTGHRAAVDAAARFVHGDLHDVSVLASVLEGAEAVLHFAARSLVPESMRDPLGYYASNVGGAIALVRGMLAHDVRRLVFSSSAAVYGEPAEVPTPESAPARPTHAYGGSKRAIEMLLEDAGRAHGIRSLSLRYFNAAGASARCGEDHRPETHLIPNLLQAASAPAVPLTVHGDDYATRDGTCVRDYVHVDDLARAHVAGLEALDSGVQGALNLGSGRGQSVLEIVAAARRVTGCQVPVRVGPRRAGDPPELVADVTRAEAEIGWRPQVDLDAMLESAWRWRERHPRGYESEAGGRGPNDHSR